MDFAVMTADPRGASPVLGMADLAPASFPLGRVWCIAVVEADRMQWSRWQRFLGLGGSDTMECFAAERSLIEAGFETYVPTERRMKIKLGRKVESVAALFGNYVFVRFDRERDSWPSSDIDHIEGVLKVMGIPARVPDLFIETLQRAEQAGTFDYCAEKSPFKQGDSVEIMEGPFAGIIAKIKAARPRQKAKLLLQALGTIEIDPCFIQKI